MDSVHERAGTDDAGHDEQLHRAEQEPVHPDAGADAAAGDAVQGDPRALAVDVAKVEKQGGVDPAVLAKAGAILQKAFKKGSPSVKKTGDAAVDALLINMGFQI